MHRRNTYLLTLMGHLLITATSLAGPIAEAPLKSEGPLRIIPGERPDPATDFLPVTEKIYALLKTVPEGEMKPYTEKVTLTEEITFDMVPIAGGEFLLGTPEGEVNRDDDEGPQRKLKIDSFWMASTETTWALYQTFMQNGKDRNKSGTLNVSGNKMINDKPFAADPKPELIDAIAQPTPPYIAMHAGMGDQAGYDEKYPAIAMTQHAASKFCEWLTAQTGHYYRLPTEAEWEYACRAGTTTAYSFGDDPSKLGDYAWYYENSNSSYQPVGTKKPNPWGLYDMHGNVREWTLDAYIENYNKHAEGEGSPLALSPKRYPRVTRGGGWDRDAKDLRSGARRPSKQSWKQLDPQDPKSIWYHTNAWGLGFRVIRPAKNPSLKEMHLLWNTGPGERF